MTQEKTMTYDQNNIFAKILRGEIPCKKIKEGKHHIAFHDLYPKADIHILVIPKGSYVTYDEFISNASSEEQLDFFYAIADLIKEYGLDKRGYKLHNNNLPGGGQHVPHLHMHILGWNDFATGADAHHLTAEF